MDKWYRWDTLAGFALMMGMALATVGCGSSPEPIFFALAPTAGAAQTSSLHLIKLRRPGLAGYLDRPEIVRKVVDYKLGVTMNERWASPLDLMMARTLAQDIEARVIGAHVSTEDGAITVDPDATVEIDIQRCDVGEDGALVLIAEVVVEKGATHTSTGAKTVRVSEVPANMSTGAIVKSMSDLLGQLSDNVAAILHAS